METRNVNRPKRTMPARARAPPPRPLRRAVTDAETTEKGPEIINDLNAAGINLDYWVTGYGE